MKRSILYLIIILFTCCKTTKPEIVGIYSYKNSNYNVLKINADHTFQYEKLDIHQFFNPSDTSRRANYDCSHTATSGVWYKNYDNKLILNNCDNDTTDVFRYWRLSKNLNNNNNEIKVSFKNLIGETIGISGVSHNDNWIGISFHKTYRDFSVEVGKYDNLVFDFGAYFYKPLVLDLKDSSAADYTITLAPHFLSGYFKNEIVTLHGKNIICRDSVFNKVRIKK
ncbi:hypothetical protein GCM10023149_39470 [Mucilaginibacter gynuensis]|uniref:Uncharacterized protein n=1 Tax=Mucilaginibacter gynuensis TaxID=1302236 RepID=A0ABP8H1B8_9SPHI